MATATKNTDVVTEFVDGGIPAAATGAGQSPITRAAVELVSANPKPGQTVRINKPIKVSATGSYTKALRQGTLRVVGAHRITLATRRNVEGLPTPEPGEAYVYLRYDGPAENN